MDPVEARAGASSEPGQEKLVTVVPRIWPVVNANQNATFCGIRAQFAGDGKTLPGAYPETGAAAEPDQRTQPALPSAGRPGSGGDRSWSLLVPPEHAHGPQSVPPARSSLALVHGEVQPAAMGILEGPGAVRIALGLDQVDRLGQPLVRNGAGRAHVVETSEHVIVPIGRVGE